MLFNCNCQPLASAVLLLLTFAPRPTHSSTITSSSKTTSTANPSATCEARTINYITDALPQLCFKSSWSANASAVRTVSGEMSSGGERRAVDRPLADSNSTEAHETTQIGSPNPVTTSEPAASTSYTSPSASTETGASEDEVSELDEGSFLSFEEWKKQALEKAGQQNSQVGSKKVENRRKDPEHTPESLGSFGEEGEIEIDFGAFRGSGKEPEAAKATEVKKERTPEESQNIQTEKRREHRSKDAGKTCKERFSYASFDAGATVVKTHQGAKNSKSVLIENKDSYMLSVCSKENKFIIIELSEDIWIDTVVLANYEFFSSMFRQFRVSVSDRYPVKLEKWKNVGVYEARNSRDIQAFLIENPQIWARYIRIEFLSHFGNEYYCPLSLVRVHGTRMLESWKESEAIGEDDDADEENEDDISEARFEPEAVADVVKEEERHNLELRKQAEEMVRKNHEIALANAKAAEQRFLENGTSPWAKFSFASMKENGPAAGDVCLPKDAPAIIDSSHPSTDTIVEVSHSSSITSSSTTAVANTSSARSTTAYDQTTKESANHSTSSTTSIASSTTSSLSHSQSVIPASHQQVTSQPSKTQTSTGSHKNKTSATSSASSSLPTIQESFFKAVSRRLQLLETNSTLSLKYIEEQSRILREAFSKVEKKQSQKTTSFLDTLNSTVLTELRGFRQQYDEIWQSTIISLESQREESRREIIAVSARLNILADEVVFQKRMSIIQSVLLLLCLGLVIFSRVSSTGQGDLLNLQNRFRSFGAESPLQSAACSPGFRRMDSIRSEQSWTEGSHNRVVSEDFSISRSGSLRNGAQTPTSIYSRSDYNFTPPSRPEEVQSALADEYLELRADHLEPPRPQPHRRVSGLANEQETTSHNRITSVSPARSSRKRNSSIRQVASPPITEATCSSLETTPEPDDLTPHFPNHSQIGLALGSPSPIQEPHTCPLPDDGVEKEGKRSRNQSFSISRKPLPALPSL